MSPRRRRSPLVERQEQLLRLDAALEAAAAGEPSLTILAGEAGIGKSRLTRALEERSEKRGMLVLRGDCQRLGDGELPLAPLATALRATPEAVLGALAPAVRGELAAAFPQLSLSGGAPKPLPEADRHAQRRLFDSLWCLLMELSDRTPVLLVIEDFHWIDRATREFIGFLALGARRERIATVITYREFDDTPPSTVEMLADLQRVDGVERIDLPALSREGIEALTREALGGRPSVRLVDDLHRRSHGNPFFAEQLLAALDGGPDAKLPAGVTNVVLRRLRRVAPPTQHLLRVAAVFRRPVTWDLLAAGCGLEAADLSAAMREALDQHLLVEEGTPPTFAFRHDLLAEAVYESLHAGERIAIHAAIAAELAKQPETPPGELASHWRAAGARTEALLASILAGLDAERTRAYAVAADDFRAAADLWDSLDEAPVGAALERADLAAHLVDALRHAGDYSAAASVGEAALAELDETADPTRAAALHEKLGRLHTAHSEIALEHFQHASRLQPESDPGERARLVAEEALALLGVERWSEACDRAEEATRLALEAGIPGEVLYARTVRGMAFASDGRFEEGEESLRVGLQTPAGQARPDDALRAHVYLGEVRRLRGHFAGALAAMEQGASLALELGMQGSFGWFMEANGAADLFHLGRWAEAEERLEAVRDRSLPSWTETLLRQVSGQLALARGDLDAAATELHLGRKRCEDAQPECTPPIYAALAELELLRGDLATARDWVDRGLSAMEGTRELLYTPALHSIGARVEAESSVRAMDARRPDIAHLAHAAAQARERDLADRFEGHRFQAPPTAVAHRASCDAETLRAAAELGRVQTVDRGENWVRAAEAWDRAAGLWRDVGAPYATAYARWRQAQAILLAGGGRPAAAEALRAGFSVADEIGAAPLRSALEQLAREARIDPAPAAPSVPRARDPMGLTPRELHTLQLLGAGMTNVEIAEKLVISKRTVDVHVSNILRKLEAGNRTEAVAAALRLGLIGDPAVT